MEKLLQEYILSIIFSHCIEREELLTKKYESYYDSFKNQEFKDMVKEYTDISREHIKMLKDKMIKLNIQG